MQSFSFHYYRQRNPLLNWVAAFTIVLLVLTSQFSVQHAVSHIGKAEMHCVLCVSSRNVDHNLLPPLGFEPLLVANGNIIDSIAQSEYLYSTIVNTSNRDPPSFI